MNPPSTGLRVTNAGVLCTVHLNARMHWGTRQIKHPFMI